MAIGKLNLKVLPKEKAKASDFNKVTGKIDEIIDHIGGGMTYYAECDSLDGTQYKEVSADNFGIEDDVFPVHSTLLSVMFKRGNISEKMHIRVNSTLAFPVWYGNAPVPGDAIEENQIVTMVFDRSEEVWRIISGVTKQLPALYVDAAFNLKFLLAGRYNAEMLEKLYASIVGTNGNEIFRGNQILVLYNKTYVPVTLVEEQTAYTFEFIYGGKHYEFCIHRLGSGELELDITDSGSSIVTHWEG